MPADAFQQPQGFFVPLTVNEVEEGRRIFDQLAEGGTVSVPYEAAFWSPGFGVLTDRFGIPWEVNCQATPAAA